METKISFVLKLMLSMFGVPKAVACFADDHVWQQTAKGLEEADGAVWRPFTSAVMQCETDELLSVDDTQQDHRSAVAGGHSGWLCCVWESIRGGKQQAAGVQFEHAGTCN